MSKGYTHWSDRELRDLAAGVQKYGFCDPQKLSSLIKTKSASSIKTYIRYRINELRKAKMKLEKETTGKKNHTFWNVEDAEDVKNWSTLRKWMKIAVNQLSPSAAKKDYSRIIIKNLCQKFYDEAEEVTNPELLDVKAIYKYMLQCVSGEVPSQLPIKESTYVLVLFRYMKDILQRFDFQEEQDFISNFQRPVEFVPIKVKDEFKKSVAYKPGTVPIPIDLYENFLCHHQVVNSFNPFGVPMWLLSKEQDYINSLFKDSGGINSVSSKDATKLPSTSESINSSSGSKDSSTTCGKTDSLATSGEKEK